MNLEHNKKGKVVIINFEGRFDIHQSLEAEKSIHAILDKDEKHIVIDLENTEYLSSSGLRVLIAVMRRIKGLHGELKLANMNRTVKRTFEIVELLDLFEVYPSVKEALNSFH